MNELDAWEIESESRQLDDGPFIVEAPTGSGWGRCGCGHRVEGTHCIAVPLDDVTEHLREHVVTDHRGDAVTARSSGASGTAATSVPGTALTPGRAAAWSAAMCGAPPASGRSSSTGGRGEHDLGRGNPRTRRRAQAAPHPAAPDPGRTRRRRHQRKHAAPQGHRSPAPWHPKSARRLVGAAGSRSNAGTEPQDHVGAYSL
jgi:hypothetical protein